jgi:hypothetical protein
MEAHIRGNGSKTRNMDTGNRNGQMVPNTMDSGGTMLLTAKVGFFTKMGMYTKAT